MCTVFAESEATSLMARGETPANIAMGLHLAIVQRTVAMLRRVGLTPPLVFAGGVAHNPCVLSSWRKASRPPSSSRSSLTWWAPWGRPYMDWGKRASGEEVKIKQCEGGFPCSPFPLYPFNSSLSPALPTLPVFDGKIPCDKVYIEK